MSIIINPGSGPVGGATVEHARANAVVLVADVALQYGVDTVVEPPFTDLGDGRWSFVLVIADTRHEVQMPGLPVEQVRYLGTEDQNIWDFPRLYVDGSSWVWKYAVNNCGPEEGS